MSANSPGKDQSPPSSGPGDVPEPDNIVQEILQRSDSEPSFALSLAGDSVFDELGRDPIDVFPELFESEDAAIHSSQDEDSVYPSEAADLSVARYPTHSYQEGEEVHEATQLHAQWLAIRQETDALGELIRENQAAKLTEEAKTATRFLIPKPPNNVESDDDERKPAAVSARKGKESKRGPYRCNRCGNEKKDHICDLLVKSLFTKATQTVKTVEEIKGEADREIDVRTHYDAVHINPDDTETERENIGSKDNQCNPSNTNETKLGRNDTAIYRIDEESSKSTSQGDGHSKGCDADDAATEEINRDIEEAEAVNVDSVVDSNNQDGQVEESPQAEELRDSASTSGPVEVLPGDDQRTIAADTRSVLHVDSDEDIEIVPV